MIVNYILIINILQCLQDRTVIYEDAAEKEKRTLAVRILNSVPGPGLEPGWVAPTVFETVASTDSAIRALL